MARGVLTGVATFVGGAFHTLPFLISDLDTALALAYVLVAFELLAIAWIRQRFLRAPFVRSLVQVALLGAAVAVGGAVLGHA